MTPARERGLTALLCAAGAGLTLLAAGRPWATVRARDAITPFALEVTGRDLGATAGALGWAALAALAALFATRGKVRAGVGLLLAAFGAVIALSSVTAIDEGTIRSAAGDRSALLRIAARPVVETGPWWAVSLCGGALVALAGLAALLRGGRWPGLSSRYERRDAAPGRARPGASGGGAASPGGDPADLWKSLDRGEDPTRDPAGDPQDRAGDPKEPRG
ncbi:Trp biosynthesis-associated membrane protein [Actinomadura kijaniata]|uniref:Trp biosynthesis-associated membrane protein n=1 Tax=Actinomadura kijaniata TaxID=46161 RepID=UPI003F1A634F